MQLQDKVALITGAGSGIGKAMALEMAREGANIVVNDVTSSAAETTAHEVEAAGRQALSLPADVSD